MPELTDLDLLALSRLFDARCKQAKAARAGLEEGEYDVDMTVRVQGSLKIGKDYTSHIVAKADPWALLAIALDKLNGVTVEALVREAEEISKAQALEVKQVTADAMQAIKGTTATPCKGKVTATLTATPIGETVVSSNSSVEKKSPTVLVVKQVQDSKKRVSRRSKKNKTDNPDQTSLPL